MPPEACVFCYGTLLFGEVMRLVTGREFEGLPGSALGWACYRVRGEVFPALVAEPGARTRGLVFRRVDARSLAALDAFEGPLYQRRALAIRCDDGATRAAEAFVLAPGGERALTREAWDRGDFERRELRAYCARIAASGTPYASRSQEAGSAGSSGAVAEELHPVPIRVEDEGDPPGASG